MKKTRILKNIILLLLIYLITSFQSCKKEKIEESASAKLLFNTDTVFFDTVFTNIGSVTKVLKVYNKNNGTINIDEIKLAKVNSPYRLNINGINSNSAKNLTLAKNDSMYIFVEVTIDPTNESSPFVAEDSIIFRYNGNLQDIDLRAWGQNANYIDGRTDNAIIGNETWTADKPYLIYNSMLVDTDKTLTIEAGTQIFLHKNSSIYILGTLIINGTKDKPVVIRGDRLDHDYDDIPGQWGRIIFINPSKNNFINHAVISGGIIGVQVGGVIENTEKPDLHIANTIIQHMNYACLYGMGAKILASNCVFANAGFYNIAIVLGGNYEFYQCTSANYWDYAARTEPSVVVSNSLTTNDAIYVSNLEQCYFANSIIYGDKENEFGINKESGADFNYKLENCIVKANESMDFSDNNIYINVWKNLNPKFVSPNDYNWKLDTLSDAEDRGNIDIVTNYNHIPDITTDIEENSRIINTPDLGAYERIY